MIVVSGQLQIRSWNDKDGNKRRNAEVIASNVYFGDSKNSGNADNTEPSYSNPAPASDFALLDNDEPLPF